MSLLREVLTRFKDTETQRRRDTKTQRRRDAETQRRRDILCDSVTFSLCVFRKEKKRKTKTPLF